MTELVRTYKLTDSGAWGWVTEEAEGGGGSQTDIPQADPTGAVLDTTTYDNPISGSGKMAVLVFPQDTATIAFALEGDAFPRWIFCADPSNGLFIGDGTVDPTEDGQEVFDLTGPYIDGTFGVGYGGTPALEINAQPGLINRKRNRSSAPLTIQNSSTICSGEGAPTGAAGTVGDLYIRTDPPDVNQYLYRCTVEGAAGAATWVALGGLA